MNSTTAVAQSPATLKWLWMAVGALGVSVLALGGTLLAQNLRGDAPVALATQELAQEPAPVATLNQQKVPQTVLQQAHAAPDSRVNQAASRPAQPGPARQPQPVAQARPAAPVCASCGQVESVQAVEQAAPATGLGAVAGGVLGGVLGNQVGKGSGRTAATVLGAVGGGYVGHKVEERARSTTVYQMRGACRTARCAASRAPSPWPRARRCAWRARAFAWTMVPALQSARAPSRCM